MATRNPLQKDRADPDSLVVSQPRTALAHGPNQRPPLFAAISPRVLTKLEAKLGEVTGLAMSAHAAGKKVMTLGRNDRRIVAGLEKVQAEAAETEQRRLSLAGTFEGKKTAILEEARSVKAKGAEMMRPTWTRMPSCLTGLSS